MQRKNLFNFSWQAVMWLAFALLLVASNAMAEEEFLPPEEAFQYSIEKGEGDTVYITWDIVPDYYLYKDNFEIADDDGPIEALEWPDGESIEDEFFGRSEVYFNEVTVKAEVGEADTLSLTWQGCAEAGLCYPPQMADVDVPSEQTTSSDLFSNNDNSSSFSSAPTQSDDASEANGAGMEQGEDQRLADRLASGNGAWAIAIFFGLGLLLVFTPCVLPMLPVLSSLVVGSESRSRKQAFILSVAYVVPMALTYAVMGVLAAMAGANLQAVLQQPAVLIVFSILFVVLAAAMFGLYELQLPSWLRDRLNNVSEKQKGGTLVGAGLMGVLSAVLVGPCMTAPLAGALLYIAESGNLWFGGLTLFALGLGMGAPLVLAMTVGAGLLPKPGGWMDGVKVVFGFLLLGLAIWFAQRIIPGAVVLILSGALTLAVAVTLWRAGKNENLAMHPLANILQTIAIVVGFWAALMMVGGAAGSKDPVQPLKGIVGSSQSQESASADDDFMERFQTITSMDELDHALEQAEKEGRWVLVDYYADWCISCHVIEKNVFGNAEVQQELMDDVVLLRPDVTKPTDDSKALLGEYGIMGPPTILLIGPDGKEHRNQRIVGELSAKEFLQRWQKARS